MYGNQCEEIRDAFVAAVVCIDLRILIFWGSRLRNNAEWPAPEDW